MQHAEIATSATYSAHLFVAGVSSSANVSITSTAGSSSSPSPLTWQLALVADDADWHEFSLLAAQWKRETGKLSSRTKKAASRFYRRIIEMGRDRAVPQIIRQLANEGPTPSHWWPALEELTGEKPVPADVALDIEQASRIWIDWGHRHYAGKLGPERLPQSH
jgi:hypothetical protein